MKILLVNDDGYQALGLKLLKEKLLKYGDVYVVAPYKHMSGKSVSLTIYEPFKVHKIDDKFYAIEGNPADCVSFGLTSLGIQFDLVCSGINNGMNVTYDILHSGTIGACIEALMYKTRAIAFSMEGNMEIMINYVDMALEYVFNNNLLSLDYFVSINFPYGDKVNGIVFSRCGYRNDKRYFVYDDKNDVYVPHRIIVDDNKDENADVNLIRTGYISITPLSKSFYDENLYLKLKLDKKL